jgi:hypothetical protein
MDLEGVLDEFGASSDFFKKTLVLGISFRLFHQSLSVVL